MDIETYRGLADGIAIFHTSFVAFVVLATPIIVLGGIMGWRWVRNPWFRGIHLWMTVIVPFEMVCLSDFECPVTTWEWELRVLGKEIAADYRQTNAVPETGFIARHLHSLIPEDSTILPITFGTFGLVVFGSILFIPPRCAPLVIGLNASSLALCFVSWLYTGEPHYWGQTAPPHGLLICLWNALPFVIAGGLAIHLRRCTAASVLLCLITVVMSWRGMFILRIARNSAGESGLGAVEWTLPLAELLILGMAYGLARVMARSPSHAPHPTVTPVQQAG